MFQTLHGNKIEKGFMMLEVIISVMLIGLVFLLLIQIAGSVLSNSSSVKQTAQVQNLIKEEIEAARAFRDSTTWGTNGLGTLTVSSPYYFSLDNTSNPPKWKINSGTETINGFTRKIVFDKVSRDPATGNIQSSYNSLYDDPDTRKITVTVTAGTQSYQIITYLTNWRK